MIKNGCLKFCSLLLISIAFTVTSFAQVRIVHNPVFFAKENQPIPMSVRVDGGVSLSDELRVYYRLQGTDDYSYIILDNLGNEFKGQIPAQNISAVKVEYFLSLIKSGNIYTLPENNPYYEPFEIQLTPNEAVQEEAPPPPLSELSQQTGDLLPSDESKYLILSPEDGERVIMEDIVIAVSLFFDPGEIDVYKTVLLIDGRQVKPELSEDLITFVPPRINEGWHEVDLYFSNADGQQYQPVRWRFNATSATKMRSPKTPLITGASGRIYTESRTEKYSGVKFENNLIGGQFSGKKSGIDFGTRFYVTSLEDKSFQPRNRFLFWFDAKLLKLYVGDTQPRFSELMLSGKRVRGINAQLNLRIINFDFVMGETYRSVEGTYAAGAIQRFGTFTQNLLGLKTSFGNPNGTHFGISALKVKDDVNSIQYGLKPKDNVVAGSEFELSLFRNRFRWRSEVAFSLLTDDISGGAITQAELDDLIEGGVPIDPADYEKYLILNATTIPLDPTKGSSVSYTSTLQLNMLNNQITVKYKSIGAKYNSLGNPFIRKNIRGLFVNDRIRLWRNRIYLNLGYEKYKDNFSQENGSPILDLETLQYGFNFFPGSGLPNFNVNYRSYKRNNGVISFDQNAPNPIDSRENNTQNEVTFNVNYDFTMLNLKHNLSVNYITLDKKDAYANNRLPVPQFFPLGINNDIQSFSLQTKYNVPLTTTISYANNENSFIGGLNLFKFNSLDLRGDYYVLQNRLNLYAGFRQFSASGGTNLSQPGASFLGNTVIKYAKTQFDIGGRLTVKQRHIFNIDLTSINFQDDGGFTNVNTGQFVPNQSFKDYSIRFRYELQF